jgi:hypothetical protein
MVSRTRRRGKAWRIIVPKPELAPGGGEILTDADAGETPIPQQGFQFLVIPPAQNRGKTGPFERGTIR